MKSFQRKDDAGPKPPTDDPGNPTVNFKGEKRRNDTHESKTDEDARLARKGNGREAKLAYCGNVMIENRHGLVVDVEVLQANGTTERDAALVMVERIAGEDRITIAGDKGYDTKDFIKDRDRDSLQLKTTASARDLSNSDPKVMGRVIATALVFGGVADVPPQVVRRTAVRRISAPLLASPPDWKVCEPNTSSSDKWNFQPEVIPVDAGEGFE